MTGRDDHLLAPTRWTAAVIIPVLIAAFVILFLFPTRTAQLWAWTIGPPMTAMVMGGGYLSGAYLFTRLLMVRRWHLVSIAFVSTTVFTSFLLAATLLHWEKFNYDHVSFWAWLLLYVITPPLLPWLWARNQRRDPGTEAGEAEISTPVRVALTVAGAGMLGTAIVLLVRPETLVPHWPWTLTPLTARTVGAFVAFPSVTMLWALRERRWSSFRIPLEAVTAGLVLVAVAAVIRRADLVGPTSSVRLFAVSLAATIALLVALQVVMNRRARTP